jgi:hypothetical protein
VVEADGHKQNETRSRKQSLNVTENVIGNMPKSKMPLGWRRNELSETEDDEQKQRTKVMAEAEVVSWASHMSSMKAADPFLVDL